MGGTAAVAAVPCHTVYCIAAAVLIATTAVAASGRELPLRLRRKTEVLSGKRVQLADEILTIVP